MGGKQSRGGTAGRPGCREEEKRHPARQKGEETALAEPGGWTLRVQSWSHGGTCPSRRGAVRAGPHGERGAGFSSSLTMMTTKCQVLR